jgi:putative endonuclease
MEANMHKRQQGNDCENLARLWLESKGYDFIAGNYMRRIGEIDLIMRSSDGHTIVFVEVRYRGKQLFGGALASVDAVKQNKLRRTANAWLQKNADSLTPARIDVIALCPQTDHTPTEQEWHGHELTWIRNAVEG